MKYSSLSAFYSGIANAIRDKKGASAPIVAEDFPEEIESIETGTDVSQVTAGASDVLSGKKIVNANGVLVNGTMPNRNQTIGTLDLVSGTYTIPEGYHDGTGYATAQIVSDGGTVYAQQQVSTVAQKGTFLKGNLLLGAVSTNINAANIKKGVELKVNNGQEDIISITGTYEPKNVYVASLTSSTGVRTYTIGDGTGTRNLPYVTIERGANTFDFNPKVIAVMGRGQVLATSLYLQNAVQQFIYVSNPETVGVTQAIRVGTGARQFNPNASTLQIPVTASGEVYDVLIYG